MVQTKSEMKSEVLIGLLMPRTHSLRHTKAPSRGISCLSLCLHGIIYSFCTRRPCSSRTWSGPACLVVLRLLQRLEVQRQANPLPLPSSLISLGWQVGAGLRGSSSLPSTTSRLKHSLETDLNTPDIMRAFLKMVKVYL